MKAESIQVPEIEAKILLEQFADGIVALDVETTGLSPLIDEIVELSAIKLTENGVETFSTLVKPSCPIPPITTSIHGIDDKMVAKAPKIGPVLKKFKEFIGDLPLIGHNAKFDMGFLLFAANQEGIDLGTNGVYCSCVMARNELKHLSSFKLGNLAKEFEIPLENAHRATDDALACLRVFAKTLNHRQERGGIPPSTLEKAYLFGLKKFSSNHDFDIPRHLQCIRGPLERHEVIEILYKGGSKKNEFRPIKPVSFLPMPAGNVLYAHCLHSNMFKSFALGKIKEVRFLDETNQEYWRKRIKEIQEAIEGKKGD